MEPPPLRFQHHCINTLHMPALTGFLLCIVICFSTLLSKNCHPLEFGLKTHYGTVSATLDTVSDHSRSRNENTVYVTVTNEIVDRIRDTLATQKLCLQQIVIVYCNISGPTLSVCLIVCMYCVCSVLYRLRNQLCMPTVPL